MALREKLTRIHKIFSIINLKCCLLLWYQIISGRRRRGLWLELSNWVELMNIKWRTRGEKFFASIINLNYTELFCWVVQHIWIWMALRISFSECGVSSVRWRLSPKISKWKTIIFFYLWAHAIQFIVHWFRNSSVFATIYLFELIKWERWQTHSTGLE